MSKEYRNISIPAELIEKVEEYIFKRKALKFGYRSVSEFVIATLRNRLEDVEEAENRGV